MSVASNTFKKERKVYTKSGKPEQVIKLASGAEVSVNNKELRVLTNNALKENTVRDIQVALGIPGKRNNLKGQGAKNIRSFDTGAGGDDSSPDDDADNASESPPGGVGMGGSDSADSGSVSPFSDTDPDGFGLPSDIDEDFEQPTVGKNYGYEEEEEPEYTGFYSNTRAAQRRSARDQEIEREAEEFEGYTRTGTDIGAGSVIGTLVSLPFGGLLGTGISLAGKGFDIVTEGRHNISSSKMEADPTAESRAAARTPTGLGGKGVGGEEVDAPVPSPEGESGNDYIPPVQRPKAVRAASNNVDLAIGDDDTTKYTRSQLRNARRSTTRYA
jgi:hypothetical protein